MIQNFVKLTEPGHAYADLNGQPYTSVSKVLDSLEEAQDWWKIAGNCAGNGKYVGMTQQQVFDAWDKNKVSAGNSGTRGHNALECYSKTFNVPEGSEDLLPMAKSVHADYKDYYGTEEEACLYYKRDGFLIAGTTDKILRVKKKGGLVDMCDYKFNPTGITYKSKDNKYLKHPVSHLQDCKFNRYAIQLSIYGVMYESLTDETIRSMWITYFPPEDYLKHYRIPVPYMKETAIAILEWYSNKAMPLKTLTQDGDSQTQEEIVF